MHLLRAHGTTELDNCKLYDQHVTAASKDLDLQLWSNAKFGTVNELFPPGSNSQAAICGTDGVPSLHGETFTLHDEGNLAPSASIEILGDTFRQFLIQSKRYHQKLVNGTNALKTEPCETLSREDIKIRAVMLSYTHEHSLQMRPGHHTGGHNNELRPRWSGWGRCRSLGWYTSWCWCRRLMGRCSKRCL
jgi:hypothetical protein